MTGLHAATKGERDVIRQLVHSVLVRDMGTFTPERFRAWAKTVDNSFRKVGLTMQFKIHDRFPQFTVKQLRGGPGGGRTLYRFTSSTAVKFDERDVMPAAPVVGPH